MYTNYTYAQIKSDDTYLYKTPNNATVQNAYFALPNTYFVMLLSNYNDYLYKVQYKDLVGFVLKQKVYPVKEKPQKPFLENITFRVYSSDGTKVYNSPFNTQEQTNFNFVEVFETINYYGYILGDELIENRGLTWYYGKTNYSSNNSPQNESVNQTNNITGYFYSGLCDSLSSIPQNTESVTYTNQVFLDEDNSFLFSLIDLSPALKILLVVLITLPSIGLIYLLFAPFKIRQEKLKNKTKNSYYKNKIKNKDKYKSKTAKIGFLAKLKAKQNKTKTLKNTKSTSQKNVLQNYKTKRKNRNKNATINKIQKIIDDDIL
ncbi:MAG: hypothetical protein IJW32_03820 [Clostridia bacterium]|nr:hypothetical protein [Clostridia bacterium]